MRNLPTVSSWGRVPSESASTFWHGNSLSRRRLNFIQSLQTQGVVGNFPIWTTSRVPMEPHAFSCSACLKIFRAATLGSKNCDPYPRRIPYTFHSLYFCSLAKWMFYDISIDQQECKRIVLIFLALEKCIHCGTA